MVLRLCVGAIARVVDNQSRRLREECRNVVQRHAWFASADRGDQIRNILLG